MVGDQGNPGWPTKYGDNPKAEITLRPSSPTEEKTAQILPQNNIRKRGKMHQNNETRASDQYSKQL
jgi:hypothetical protein